MGSLYLYLFTYFLSYVWSTVRVQSLTEAFKGLASSDVDAANYDSLDVEGQLTDLRLLTSFLETEVNALRQENADFRRDAMMTSSPRSHASLTTDDVSRLMAKMAEMVNDTATRQSTTKHGAAGFPRGTVTWNYRNIETRQHALIFLPA